MNRKAKIAQKQKEKIKIEKEIERCKMLISTLERKLKKGID